MLRSEVGSQKYDKFTESVPSGEPEILNSGVGRVGLLYEMEFGGEPCFVPGSDLINSSHGKVQMELLDDIL